MGKLTDRYSHLTLIATGCLAGAGYYAGLAFVSDPWSLLALQLLNAWFFAAVAGVGLPLFQDLIPRPGLATGLYMNTRRLGAIVSGPIIAIGALSVLGDRGIFLACAGLTVLALLVVGVVARTGRSVTTNG
jgi:SET family sugar efflux transporter-like MFS transporter